MKKMFKRAAAIVLALSLAAGAAASARETNYYEDFEYPNIDFSQMDAGPYDTAVIDELNTRIRGIMDTRGDFSEISMLLDNCETELKKVISSNMYTLIENNLNNNDKTNAEHAAETEKQLFVAKTLETLFVDLYNNGYADELAEKYGEAAIKKIVENQTSDEFLELSNKENELLSEYYANQRDAGKCAEIFMELVELRNSIAAAEGYDSYADYAYERLYSKDYTSADTAMFGEYAKEYILPFFAELNSNVEAMAEQGEIPEFTDDEIKELVGGGLDDLSSELKECFDYMFAYNLADISFSETKTMPGTGVTFSLPLYNSNYLLISRGEESEYDRWTLGTLVHEFGHFNSGMRTIGQIDVVTMSDNVDLAETQSQGLELLFMKEYDGIFKGDAEYRRMETVRNLLNVLIEGCVFDEWQQRVYAEEELTPDRADELLEEVYGEYGARIVSDEENAARQMWTMLGHNFITPFYYISYATSAMAAFELLAESEADYDSAFDKYMEITKCTPDRGFRNALEECGLRDVFSEEAFEEVAGAVTENYCGFNDVSPGDWFNVPVLFVSSWLEGGGNNFRPEENTTREEFVTALGKMYDGFFGIDAEGGCPFTDVEGEELAEYVTWANENDIVYGVGNNLFGGGETITREQLVTFMYRLADYSGADMTAGETAEFGDAEAVSDYAAEAVSWAFGEDIINGYGDGTFKPQNTVTRAETAQILRNFSVEIY